MSDSKMKVRLFKCIGKDAIESTIKEGTAKLTRLDQSNDPMEFRPKGCDNQLREWYDFIQSIQPAVLCMSSKFSSPPMWAHYANNHEGAAVAFDFDIQRSFKIPLLSKAGLKDSFLYMHKISKEFYLIKCVYCKERVVVPLNKKERNKIRIKCQKKQKQAKVENDICFLTFQLTALKGAEWAYENEYRLISMDIFRGEKMSDKLIVTCFKENISGILTGYKNDKVDEIAKIAEEYRSDIFVKPMICSSDKFEMECATLPRNRGIKKLEEIEKNAEEIDVLDFLRKITYS